MSVDYEETFYIIPRYIRKIPHIPQTFLDVYESMFQFWNKGLTCFLSNKSLSEKSGCSLTQVKDALLFFEKNGHLRRENRGRKRFLIKPETKIEIDQAAPPATSINNNQLAAVPATRGRSTGLQEAAPPATEYKEVEYKETNTTSSNNFLENYQQKQKENLFAKQDEIDRRQLTEKFRKESLSDQLAISIYRKRFEGLTISLEQLYDECVDYWSQTNQQVYKARFITHLRKAPIEKYKDCAISKSGNHETEQERNQRYAKEREKQKQKLNGDK